MNGYETDTALSRARAFRAAAWLMAFVIVLLSIVPAGLRPVTAAPHAVEHALIFVLTGLSFGLGYRHRRAWQLVSLTAFAAMVEVAQVWTPTRHARLSDFTVDTIGCFVGVGLAVLAARYLAGVRST